MGTLYKATLGKGYATVSLKHSLTQEKMGIPVWKKCCCCSIPIACLVIGILGVINSISVLYLASSNRGFYGFVITSTQAYVELILGAFGLAAFGCLIFTSIKKTEKMLVPALVLIPIDILHGIIYMILFAIKNSDLAGEFVAITLIAII